MMGEMIETHLFVLQLFEHRTGPLLRETPFGNIAQDCTEIEFVLVFPTANREFQRNLVAVPMQPL